MSYWDERSERYPKTKDQAMLWGLLFWKIHPLPVVTCLYNFGRALKAGTVAFWLGINTTWSSLGKITVCIVYVSHFQVFYKLINVEVVKSELEQFAIKDWKDGPVS